MARAHEPGIDFRAVGKRVLFFAVVVVLAAVALAELPGIDDVRKEFSQAEPGWIVAAGVFRILSMLGFVRALWSAFDRVMPWRRALVLGMAEQGANVLLPAGGAGGPAYGAYVLTRLGVPADLAAQRHAALFLVTSAVSFGAIIVAGTLTAIGLLPGDVALMWTLGPAARDRVPVRAGGALWAHRPAHRAVGRARAPADLARLELRPRRRPHVAEADPARGPAADLRFGHLLRVRRREPGLHVPGLRRRRARLGLFVLAYALGHAGALIPTPGGVGGTEGGLIGAFVAYGTPLPLAAAAVVGYRVFQLGLPALFGAVALVRVQRVLAHPPPREEIAARYEAHRWR